METNKELSKRYESIAAWVLGFGIVVLGYKLGYNKGYSDGTNSVLNILSYANSQKVQSL